MITTYAARPADIIITHGAAPRAWLVHDMADNHSDLELDAFVASGDCFEMLATNLDKISALLPYDGEIQSELEYNIRLLLALQLRYKVVRKFPADHGASRF